MNTKILTKSDFTSLVEKKYAISSKQLTDIANLIHELLDIYQIIETPFATFSQITVEEHAVTNPASGEPITVKERKVYRARISSNIAKPYSNKAA